MVVEKHQERRQQEAFKNRSSTFMIKTEKEHLFSKGFDEEEKQAYVEPPESIMGVSFPLILQQKVEKWN